MRRMTDATVTTITNDQGTESGLIKQKNSLDIELTGRKKPRKGKKSAVHQELTELTSQKKLVIN